MIPDDSKTEMANMRVILGGHLYQLATELEPIVGFWPLPLMSEILSGKRRAIRGKSRLVAEALRQRAAELKAERRPGKSRKRSR